MKQGDVMAYENFIVERAAAVATVYFNRPEKLNPISGKLLTEMLEVANEFRDDEETRVVILTGKGRSFNAGADIGGLTANAGAQAQRAQTDAGRLRAARTGWRLMEDWERLDQVTIAAVNGFAIGGGLSLAMACDFRIAAAGARIWIPEVALGVPYMWGSVTRLINLVGMSKAKEMVMTCEEVSAEEALRIGLVNQVVPAERDVNLLPQVGHVLVDHVRGAVVGEIPGGLEDLRPGEHHARMPQEQLQQRELLR